MFISPSCLETEKLTPERRALHSDEHKIFCPWPCTIFWYQYNFRWNSVTLGQFCMLWDGIWHARGSTGLFVHTLVFLYNRKALACVWWGLFKATQRVVVKSLCFVGEYGAFQRSWATCEIRFVQHQWDFFFLFVSLVVYFSGCTNQMKSSSPPRCCVAVPV